MHTGKTLPSGSTSLLVLSLLASGDKYGYEMISVLEDRSDHTFTLKEGTLYPILHGLEREGAVSAYARGRRLLGEKREEWNAFSRMVNAIVAEGEVAPAPV